MKDYFKAIIGAILFVGFFCVAGAVIFLVSVWTIELLHCFFMGLNFFGPAEF